MANPFVHVELHTDDVEKAKSFLWAAFGVGAHGYAHGGYDIYDD